MTELLTSEWSDVNGTMFWEARRIMCSWPHRKDADITRTCPCDHIKAWPPLLHGTPATARIPHPPPPPAPGSPTVGKRGKGRCKACCCCFCGGPSTAGAWRSRALHFVSFTCFWQGRERGLPAVHSARRYLSYLGTKTDTYILVTSTMYTRYAHYCVAYESVHMDDR